MTATMDFHEEKGLSYEFNEYFKKWLKFRGLSTTVHPQIEENDDELLTPMG